LIYSSRGCQRWSLCFCELALTVRAGLMARRSTKRASVKADEPVSKRGQRAVRAKPLTNSVARSSPDLVQERLAVLAELVPGVVREGRINIEALRTVFDEVVDTRPDRYSFTWAGKRDAIQLLQMPSRATLSPCPNESVRFDWSANLFIEGENLEVLKLLYKPYFGQVKVIYLDPPYNTGNDFVYRDNYADPLESYLTLTGQRDAAGNVLTSNPETSGRYHSAWLSMMYPRLFIARQLLADDGVVFVSIDDHEVHNLRLLMNEVFGEENFVGQVTILTNPKGRGLREHFARSHDYLLVYTRTELEDDLSIMKSEEEVATQYSESDERGQFRYLELRNTHRQFGRFNRPNLYYPLYAEPIDGSVWLKAAAGRVEVHPHWDDGFEGCWAWGKEKVSRDRELLAGRKVGKRWKVFRKSYATDEAGGTVRKKLKTIWTEPEYQTERGQATFDELIPGRVFQSPKPVALINTALLLVNDPDAIVLDFFAGSGTTGQAVLELNREDGGNRRFILVQLPEPTPDRSEARKAGFETIADICKERIRRVIAKLEKERDGKLELQDQSAEDFGFRVFKLAESNYRPWTGVKDKDPDAYVEQMAMFADPLIPGWKPENVIWEVALKEGYALTSRIEKVMGSGRNTVWRVTDSDKEQSFLISLTNRLTASAIEALGLNKDDLFVCRDYALDDEAAANLALQLQLKTI
jgi:adenine-specific DNA-methyltransferase